MIYFKYFIYGLIQGFTEFLPISSTAHLKVLSDIFGINDPGSSLSAILQLGSVLAVIYYFRKDIYSSINSRKNFYKNFILESKLIKSLFIGSISILLLGGIIKIFVPYFSESIFRTNYSIATLSILMAILMLIADKSKQKQITLINHKFIDSLKIGLGQSLAIVPGVSRSGITMSIALLLGWEKREAAKFSFLLGVPAISIAAVVELIDSFNKNTNIPFGPLLLALTTTFLVSLFSMDFLLRFITLKGLSLFAYYRITFGTMIFLSYF